MAAIIFFAAIAVGVIVVVWLVALVGLTCLWFALRVLQVVLLVLAWLTKPRFRRVAPPRDVLDLRFDRRKKIWR